MGYLDFNGLNGTFGIGVRNTNVGDDTDAKLNSYIFTKTNQPKDTGATIRVDYVNGDGSLSLIGNVTASPSSNDYQAFLTDINIKVIGDTQQLYFGNTAFDLTTRATQATYNDSSADYLVFYTQSDATSAAFQFDNISVVPEPSVLATLVVAGACFTLRGMRRRNASHRC